MAVFVVFSNLWIVIRTSDRVLNITDLNQYQDYKVALVFGTSRYRVGGGDNPFFKNRITAASQLFEKGIVEHFILSGDNNTKYYNEPAEMKQALIEAGVPSDRITLDYAGFRTLDTVVRGKEVFDQKKMIFVTQEFHGYRALYIGAYYDMDVVCYPADYPDDDAFYKVLIREIFARPKALLDLYVLKKTPKFLGKKEPINL